MTDSSHFQPAWNFLGLPDELAAPERARAWILPIPYEGTTSYGAGTREGPSAIIAASRQVELFDREFDGEPAMAIGIHTMNPLGLEHGSPEAMVAAIENAVAGILSGTPRPEQLVVLGGEHSISGGVARGMKKAGLKDFVTVHVDAHADLRAEYEGTPYSHACAARRIVEVSPIFQVGIRNLSEGEERFRRGNKRIRTVFSEEANAGRGWLKELAKFVKGKQVYFTIDLDGLDPSIMPAVGTPEPGGLSWERLLDVARVVCREAADVPVFDVVELAPIPALKGPDFLAAKLAHKIVALSLYRRPARRR
ncbi:MAG TPA: agmatinase [Kiritimatiellia bacterium]|nr:agmatinase [Kiritimatiellia bacterium]HRZ10985.1 agmatinase [Kiritimatiellia bacterium]HSA18558.1 agmatinase [Kiritimatiellia bacterium]